MLNLLAELVGGGGPSGMPQFTELILGRILEVSEICPYPTLEWLGAQVSRNRVVHSWCVSSLPNWLEHFLISNNNQRVRNGKRNLTNVMKLFCIHFFEYIYSCCCSISISGSKSTVS